MHPLIITTNDGHCQYFYDWLRISAIIKCKCLERLELSDISKPEVSCLVFADEKDLRRVLDNHNTFVHNLPPVIAPRAGALVHPLKDMGILRYGDNSELLNLLKLNNYVQPSAEERATNIFIFISRYPFRIKNVNTIIGHLSGTEQRKIRDEFTYQFGFPMRKWLTHQKVKGILGKMSTRSETGKYLSLAKECGFESHAALSNFLHLHFRKNIRTIEAEVKGMKNWNFWRESALSDYFKSAFYPKLKPKL